MGVLRLIVLVLLFLAADACQHVPPRPLAPARVAAALGARTLAESRAGGVPHDRARPCPGPLAAPHLGSPHPDARGALLPATPRGRARACRRRPRGDRDGGRAAESDAVDRAPARGQSADGGVPLAHHRQPRLAPRDRRKARAPPRARRRARGGGRRGGHGGGVADPARSGVGGRGPRGRAPPARGGRRGGRDRPASRGSRGPARARGCRRRQRRGTAPARAPASIERACRAGRADRRCRRARRRRGRSAVRGARHGRAAGWLRPGRCRLPARRHARRHAATRAARALRRAAGARRVCGRRGDAGPRARAPISRLAARAQLRVRPGREQVGRRPRARPPDHEPQRGTDRGGLGGAYRGGGQVRGHTGGRDRRARAGARASRRRARPPRARPGRRRRAGGESPPVTRALAAGALDRTAVLAAELERARAVRDAADAESALQQALVDVEAAMEGPLPDLTLDPPAAYAAHESAP